MATEKRILSRGGTCKEKSRFLQAKNGSNGKSSPKTTGKYFYIWRSYFHFDNQIKSSYQIIILCLNEILVKI